MTHSRTAPACAPNVSFPPTAIAARVASAAPNVPAPWAALATLALLLAAPAADARTLPAGWTLVGADIPPCAFARARSEGALGATLFRWIDGAYVSVPTEQGLPAGEGAWVHALRPVALEDCADDALADYRLAWSEEFDAVDVEGWGPSNGARWFAHTPWGGDFGEAVFVPSAHRTSAGVLSITASKDAGGDWRSGLLSLRHPDGRGRAWRTGYFEARMDLPPGAGTWPAFWLGSDKNADGVNGEIDVIEHYGHAPDRYEVVAHTWGVEPHVASLSTVDAPGVVDGWHTFGVEVTSTELVYYLDRDEVWRTPRPADWADLEFYPIVNLALGSGWPIDETPNPSVLRVDWVRVYTR